VSEAADSDEDNSGTISFVRSKVSDIKKDALKSVSAVSRVAVAVAVTQPTIPERERVLKVRQATSRMRTKASIDFVKAVRGR